jgi:hypothetical protein
MAEDKTRRAFVKGAAQVAVTAPAVAILLNGTAAKAATGATYAAGDDAVIRLTADDNFADDTFVTRGDDGTASGTN